MTVQLTKDSIDLGIHVKDPEKSLAFYRDTLGFELVGEMDMPGGMHMWRLMCGTSMIKLVNSERGPKAENPGGGIIGANGYRYWTISVSNLDEIAAKCAAAGYKLAIPVTEIRPGTSIAMVEDPDGNWVEFLAGG
jgi:catechol 2,3-dioxygenase-like lactoylglutathione lyase family enzyme